MFTQERPAQRGKKMSRDGTTIAAEPSNHVLAKRTRLFEMECFHGMSASDKSRPASLL